MKALRKVSFWLMVGLLASGFASRAFGHDAKILKVTGTATVQLPGGATQAAASGMIVPEGAAIVTGGQSQVFLEVFSGGMATIAENSSVSVEKLAVQKEGETVTSQEALLDLKKGTVVSTLDPAKKAINHYGVRTPKGVAAARGTIYTVTVGDDQITIETTLSGEVIITNLTTNEAVTVSSGSASVTDSNGTRTLTSAELAEDAATSATVTRAIAIAAAAMAQVQNSTGPEFTDTQKQVAGDELVALQQTVSASFSQAQEAVTAAVQQGVVPSANPPAEPGQSPPTDTVDVTQVSAAHK